MRLMANYLTKNGMAKGNHIYKTEKAFSWIKQNSNSPFSKRTHLAIPPKRCFLGPAASFHFSSVATPFSARTPPRWLCLRDCILKLVATRMLSSLFGAGTCPPIILVTRKIRHHNKSTGASLRAQICSDFTPCFRNSCKRQTTKQKMATAGRLGLRA